MPASEEPRKTHISSAADTESGSKEGEGRIPTNAEDETTAEEDGEGTVPGED